MQDPDLKQLEEALRELDPAPLSSQLRGRISLSTARSRRVPSLLFSVLRLAAALTVAALLGLVLARLAERDGQHRTVGLSQPHDGESRVANNAGPAAQLADTGQLASVHPVPEPPAWPGRGVYRPVMVGNVLLRQRDGGIVQLPGEVPARRMHVRFHDHVEWHNAATDARLNMSRVRDHVVLRPLQVY